MVVVLVGGCAIALKAAGASLDDTVDEIFGVLGGALAALILVNLLEEQVARFGFVRDSRCTAKHSFAVVAGRAIALKAMDESLDDTVCEGGGGVCDALVVWLSRFTLLWEERQRGLDSRLTTKHGIVAGLGGSRAISWKAIVASVDDTVDGIFGVLEVARAVLVNLLVKKQVAQVIVVFRQEWRLTTKHSIVAGLGGGCAIANSRVSG